MSHKYVPKAYEFCRRGIAAGITHKAYVYNTAVNSSHLNNDNTSHSLIKLPTYDSTLNHIIKLQIPTHQLKIIMSF